LLLYRGDTKMTLAELGITEENWQVSAKQLTATLDPFNALEKEKDEAQAFVTSLKKGYCRKIRSRLFSDAVFLSTAPEGGLVDTQDIGRFLQ
jgi:hypothetical protein